MPSTKINTAIHDCLNECYKSENPLAVVAAFVERLRADPTWNDSEIEDFEVAIRRILKALMDK
jgi:hypothetical protein